DVEPWDVVPYASWPFDGPIIAKTPNIGGATFDPTTGRLYISSPKVDTLDDPFAPVPVIGVYQITIPAGEPEPDGTPPEITATNPVSGETDVDADVIVTATFGEDVQEATIVFGLEDASENPVAATTDYDSETRTVSLVPDSPLQ